MGRTGSIWEAHLFSEKQRLPVNDAPADWIWNVLQILQVREAGITFAIALRSRALVLFHQDPADRFIGASSIELKASLLTAVGFWLGFGAGSHCRCGVKEAAESTVQGSDGVFADHNCRNTAIQEVEELVAIGEVEKPRGCRLPLHG